MNQHTRLFRCPDSEPVTLNVTSPSLYALGTVTTIVSFVIISACIGAIILINRRRGMRATGH